LLYFILLLAGAGSDVVRRVNEILNHNESCKRTKRRLTRSRGLVWSGTFHDE
jgi:hypothetical protein